MLYRQFMWGLSNGIFVLALAGAFWFGLAVASTQVGWPVWLLVDAGAIAVAMGGWVVRRKSQGFRLREATNSPDPTVRERVRYIRSRFRLIGVLEMLLIWPAVGMSFYFHRTDLVWPIIGLGVSLHFLPLARLFRVNAYYALGGFGTIVSVGVFFAPTHSRVIITSLALGFAVWSTAAYLILFAERIASSAVGEQAAVVATA